MKHNDYLGLIPMQYIGKELEADATLESRGLEEGKANYEIIKNRFLDVNNWHHVAGLVSAKFQVVDKDGREVERPPQKGDYLRIDIPGPGSKAGDGYDWVVVEELMEENDEHVQCIGFRVRPSQPPISDKTDTAHFYSKEGTSNFILMREGKNVSTWIVDRNIRPNHQTESIVDQIRDSAIGIGALGLFSKAQWQGLAKGLIKV
jgi:hypothetical protein